MKLQGQCAVHICPAVKKSSIEAGWLEVGDYSVLWFRTAKKLAKHSM